MIPAVPDRVTAELLKSAGLAQALEAVGPKRYELERQNRLRVGRDD
ncbi:MAG: hypothetical protein JWN44_3069 [Myxococcales bacterium]|nr:hypothetical protein [Myxococcales bacterium]